MPGLLKMHTRVRLNFWFNDNNLTVASEMLILKGAVCCCLSIGLHSYHSRALVLLGPLSSYSSPNQYHFLSMTLKVLSIWPLQHDLQPPANHFPLVPGKRGNSLIGTAFFIPYKLSLTSLSQSRMPSDSHCPSECCKVKPSSLPFSEEAFLTAAATSSLPSFNLCNSGCVSFQEWQPLFAEHLLSVNSLTGSLIITNPLNSSLPGLDEEMEIWKVQYALRAGSLSGDKVKRCVSSTLPCLLLFGLPFRRAGVSN